MIKRDFWENIASVWSKKEKIEIPEIIEGPDVPEDFVNLEEVEDWDNLLRDLLNPDLG